MTKAGTRPTRTGLFRVAVTLADDLENALRPPQQHAADGPAFIGCGEEIGLAQYVNSLYLVLHTGNSSPPSSLFCHRSGYRNRHQFIASLGSRFRRFDASRRAVQRSGRFKQVQA
jgi:hypothetical protein